MAYKLNFSLANEKIILYWLYNKITVFFNLEKQKHFFSYDTLQKNIPKTLWFFIGIDGSIIK